MNKNIITPLVLIIIALWAILYFFYSSREDTVTIINNPSTTSITYENADYGFKFSLPITWEGYTIVKNTWTGTPLMSTSTQSGPKLLIRNPKWTASAHYEDLPIVIFTIPQWNTYLAEGFSISAAPIKATELGRNNVYVFALPPRWDYDYSLGYKEAQDIIARGPLHPFDMPVKNPSSAKLNINLVCECALTYMTFPSAKSADTFVAECKEGKHPEVIERYKKDMNLGDGATI